MKKMEKELLPPLKWSSWALEDNPPGMNVIESWYSGIMKNIYTVSVSLKKFLRDCVSDQLTGTEWKIFAQTAADKVS